MNFRWTLWRKSYKLKATKVMLEILTVTQTTLTPTITKKTESRKLSVYPVAHVETPTIPQRTVTVEPMQQTGHFRGKANRQQRTEVRNRTNITIYPRVSRLQPKPLTESVTSSLRNYTWQTTKLITLSPIPEVVWQQPPEISMDFSS